jgi:small subunit ribosomal protein S17
MTEEEKNEQTEQEEPQAEGSDDSTAGPVAEDGPPAEPEDSSPTPPAEETPEPVEETPPAESADEQAEPEEAVAEEPAAEAQAPAAEEPEEDPEADLPWKQRRRLERSRRPHEPGSQQSPEDRAAARQEKRRARASSRRRYRLAQRAKRGEPGTGTPPAEHRRNPAKVRQGVVVSDKAEKTITVRIDIARRHPTYEKIVRRSRTLHAHDERNEAGQGDVVRIIETRPLSRTKRWRLLEVIEKAR